VKLSKRSSSLVATAIAAAMLMTACGGDEEPGGEGGAEAASGGTFSIYIGEPENPLVPGNTSESEGSQVLEALWTGLVQYGDDSSVQYTGVAESIESDDATTWTKPPKRRAAREPGAGKGEKVR
jgi:ABC-type oligopeptide transport system substrate-binding subunit